MEEPVTAADANRKFSSMLRSVREGKSYLITAHGTPIAKFLPIGKHEQATSGARLTLLERLQSQPAIEIASSTRNQLYEDVQ